MPSDIVIELIEKITKQVEKEYLLTQFSPLEVNLLLSWGFQLSYTAAVTGGKGAHFRLFPPLYAGYTPSVTYTNLPVINTSAIAELAPGAVTIGVVGQYRTGCIIKPPTATIQIGAGGVIPASPDTVIIPIDMYDTVAGTVGVAPCFQWTSRKNVAQYMDYARP